MLPAFAPRLEPQFPACLPLNAGPQDEPIEMFTYEGVARLLATRSSVLPAWYDAPPRPFALPRSEPPSDCTQIGPLGPAAFP